MLIGAGCISVGSEYVLVPMSSREAEPVFILKGEAKHVIAGYASVDVVDKDNERISLEALDEAFRRMMKRKSRRNYLYHHGNIQIGEILWSYTDSKGFTWRSGVDFDGKLNEKALKAYGQEPKRGLFIICEVFRDLETGREVIEAQKKGKLLAFSVGGRVLPGGREVKCDDGTCWQEIIRLDLHEVTACEMGRNPEAKAFLLKDANNEMLLSAQHGDEKLISMDILRGARSKMGEEEILLKESIQSLTEEVKKLLRRIEEQMEKAAEVEKQEGEIIEFEKLLDIEEVEKQNYRAFMRQCLKEGKTMKQCALEWKQRYKAKPEEEEEEEEAEKAKKKKKKPYYYYKKPKKEDFESEEEYKKALEEYNKLKAEIVKELGLPAGQAIKKSLQPKQAERVTVDIDEIIKTIDETERFEDVLTKLEVDK